MSQEENTELANNTRCVNDLKVKVIGVGGAGSNIVDSLHFNFIEKVELAAVNTDVQALIDSLLNEKYKIGQNTTRGLSTGGEIALGQQAAEEDRDLLEKLVAGSQLVFIVAGLGGGTGGGASPKLAAIAKQAGALVVSFVCVPFTFEGTRKQQCAEKSLTELRAHSHAVIALSNDLLLQQAETSATAVDAFLVANKWVSQGIGSIVTMLFKTGLINLDFASLKNVFACKANGRTLFGLGCGEGDDYIKKAEQSLMQCPLLQTPSSSKKADSLLVNIYGGNNLSLAQVNEIVAFVTESFGGKSNITVGAVIDDTISNHLEICVIGITDISSRNASSFNTETLEESVVSIKSETTLRKMKLEAPAQTELQFLEQNQFRGCFEKTERSEFEGEDLDVPTYLRRGIKIKL